MPKVKGPKNGTIVTASFDPTNKKDNSKSRFPAALITTKDLVLLSIRGNEYCANEYLKAIVQEAVSKHQTAPDHSGAKGKVTFLIADEIYWHNIMPAGPYDEIALKNEALKIGEEYFEKNLAAFLLPLGLTVDEFRTRYSEKSMDEQITIINQLALEMGKNFEIVRWHTWVTQQDFDKELKEILPYYESVEGLKVAIDKSVSEFVGRHTKEGEDRGLWTARSLGYLKEESPSIMLLAALLDYNFIIYPGEILPPFEATKNFFIVGNHEARIEQGQSIKSECTHNKFCLHSENPSRLVNWLDVNFTKSFGKIENKVANNSALFFHQPEKAKKESQLKSLPSPKDDEITVVELVPRKEVIASSIIKGITQAIRESGTLSKPTSKGKKQHQLDVSQPALTQIFAGITEGVLSTDLPMSEKVGFMTELINTYVSRQTSVAEPDYPSPAALALM